MSPSGPLLASLLCIVPALAQTEAADAAPQVVLETVGPDGWRARFAPTNLGALLGSERGRGLWAPLLSPVLGWWQDAFGGEADSAADRERLLGYAGRVRAALWLDPEHGDRITAAAIVLEGDGRTDLPALAADLRRLQDGLGGEWRAIEVGGTRVDVLAEGADRFTAPIAGDAHLLFVLAGEAELDRALARGRTFAGTAEGRPPAPNAPALRIEVDTPALVAAARAAAAATDEGPTLEALGLPCLGRSRFALGALGPHVHVEFAQEFADGPRGLFAALFPTTEGLSVLRRLLPESAGSWLIGRFDALALYDAVEAVCAANDVDLDEMRAQMRGELGVDLRSDLLQHLTDEIVLFGAPGEDARPERTPWALAFRLRDRAAFAPNLETALAKAKPFLSREDTIEHGDARLHRYGSMLGYDLWLATGADLFVIAGGEDSEARLTGLFDRALAPAPDESLLPGPFAALERHLPPGLQSVARGDLDSMATLPAAFWFGLAGDFAPRQAGGDFDEQQQQLRELLAEHELDTVRSAGGYADRCWRWRMFW